MKSLNKIIIHSVLATLRLVTNIRNFTTDNRKHLHMSGKIQEKVSYSHGNVMQKSTNSG